MTRRGLYGLFARVDGLRPGVVGGGHKVEHLVEHLAALGVDGLRRGADRGLGRRRATPRTSVGAACVLYAGGFTHPDRLAGTGWPVA